MNILLWGFLIPVSLGVALYVLSMSVHARFPVGVRSTIFAAVNTVPLLWILAYFLVISIAADGPGDGVVVLLAVTVVGAPIIFWSLKRQYASLVARYGEEFTPLQRQVVSDERPSRAFGVIDAVIAAVLIAYYVWVLAR